MFHYYQQFFPYDKVDELLERGLAIDARDGGLVLGRSHEEGGIYFLTDHGSGYKLMGELEGFEYILSMGAQILLKNEFDKINNCGRDIFKGFQEYQPASHIKIIDTFLPPGDSYGAKFLLFEGLFGGQPIINKYSTLKFLSQIDEINQRYKVEYDSNMYFERTRIKIRDSISYNIIEDRPIIWQENFL